MAPTLHRQRGVAFLILLFAMLVGIGSLAFTERSLKDSVRERDATTELALKQAKEALISYAAAHIALTVELPNGPGYLPCPDRDDDGNSDWNCGNQAGTSGQSKRLGRLPWKTLRLPDLRDSSGERLWYAVSSVYKTSTLNPGLNPDTGMGTITLRDNTGIVLHDGTLGDGPDDIYLAQSGGVIAVIIAPGSPISRRETAASTPIMQDRSCDGGACDQEGKCLGLPEHATPRCNPVNYLDNAFGPFGSEDNAAFIDVNVGRAANTDGFIQGPVYASDRALLVNDRIVAITYDDIMPALMRRVAIEASHCLQDYVGAHTLSPKRYPFAAPLCRSGYANSRQWRDAAGALFGRFPEGPLAGTAAASGGEMRDEWPEWSRNRCSISTREGYSGWFDAWKDHVFFVVAPSFKAASEQPGTCTDATCLQIVDAEGAIVAKDKQFAVLVSGAPLSDNPVPQARGGQGRRFAHNYLEATNARLERLNDLAAVAECADVSSPQQAPPCEPATPCNRVTVALPSKTFNDLVLYFPE